MGGVYRIQTFFGFLYFFYIYKAPKRLSFMIMFYLYEAEHSYCLR